MTRTPDEIKKGLECCSNVNFVCNEECPYYKSLSEGEDCCLKKNADALAFIQQLQDDNAEKDKSMQQLERSLSFARDLADGLKAATVKQEQELYVSEERNRQLETQNAELSGKIGQLQAERDAAVNDLENVCKLMSICNACKDRFEGDEGCRGCFCSSHWQWRGVQKEESDDGKE